MSPNQLNVYMIYPKQQTKTAKKFKVNTDFYMQKFIKYPHTAVFHCYPELLHAALLESDKDVKAFTPQPFNIKVKSGKYVPDVHYIKNNESIVAELKPNGKFDLEKKEFCEAYFKNQNMEFIVVSNESVYEQQVKALNWLQVIRVILTSTYENTLNQELEIMSDIATGKVEVFSDVIDSGDRFRTMLEEIALYKLIYDHKVVASLDEKIINYNTRVKLC